VVGVVADFRAVNLADPPSEEMFYPSMQLDGAFMNLTVRSTRTASSLRAELVQAVHAVDPGLPVDEVQPFTQLLSQAIADRRFAMMLLTAFAVLALVLAGMGIYSVIAYNVAQRTHEFGIRMALGADAGDVVSMVMKEGLLLSGIGLALGVVLSLLASLFVGSLLFEVKATDPLILAGVSLFLAIIAALACFVPARRATRIDPMQALRAE
jgi:putative ABC transport system permease protein